MCVQCMLGAMTAGSAATGTRSWLATRRWSWLTPVRLRRVTVGLLGSALVTSAFLVGGSSAASDAPAQRDATRTSTGVAVVAPERAVSR